MAGESSRGVMNSRWPLSRISGAGRSTVNAPFSALCSPSSVASSWTLTHPATPRAHQAFAEFLTMIDSA
jgi:hypothetical protein